MKDNIVKHRWILLWGKKEVSLYYQRLLGHKDTRTIPHYRRLRNEALAEDTKAVRDEMNELLAQYRREKENAETR